MSGKNKTFSLCLARLDKSWSFMSNFFFTFQQMIDTSLENAPHQILLYKGQDVCVLYRSPNLWTNWDVIWHGGGPRGLEVLGGWPGTPHTLGMGCLWSISCILVKTKVAVRPWFSGGGSPVWAPNMDLEGPGPHVLLEPWSLTMKRSS